MAVQEAEKKGQLRVQPYTRHLYNSPQAQGREGVMNAREVGRGVLKHRLLGMT